MSRPLDRLTLLETFARIADRGSISAAARDLGLSQASASRQLKELESRLGVELVRRTTHSLTLTPAGLALLRDARTLIAGWSSLEDLHGSADCAVKGALKVVAPIALGQLHLADIAARFLAAHPKLTLTLQLDDQPIRFAEVGCDLWLKVGRVPDETLVVRPLAKVERLVVASPTLLVDRDMRTPADVERLHFIALAPFESGRIGLESYRQSPETGVEITPELRLTTDDVLVARHAALLGAGAAVLPRWLVAADLAAGRLVDALPDWRAATLEINLAYLPARRQPLRLTLFIEALVAGISEVPGLEHAQPPLDRAAQRDDADPATLP